MKSEGEHVSNACAKLRRFKLRKGIVLAIVKIRLELKNSPGGPHPPSDFRGVEGREKGRGGKEREGKGREGKGREGKEREGKGRAFSLFEPISLLLTTLPVLHVFPLPTAHPYAEFPTPP